MLSHDERRAARQAGRSIFFAYWDLSGEAALSDAHRSASPLYRWLSNFNHVQLWPVPWPFQHATNERIVLCDVNGSSIDLRRATSRVVQTQIYNSSMIWGKKGDCISSLTGLPGLSAGVQSYLPCLPGCFVTSCVGMLALRFMCWPRRRGSGLYGSEESEVIALCATNTASLLPFAAL